MKAKISDFFKKNEAKIFFSVGIIIVAILSFELGFIQGKKKQDKPIIIEVPAASQESQSGEASAEKNATESPKQVSEQGSGQEKNCQFVGSKNSNKYHLPSCRWAKNIKPENLVCFSSEDDAKLKGYLPDANCIK